MPEEFYVQSDREKHLEYSDGSNKNREKKDNFEFLKFVKPNDRWTL